MKDTHTKHRPIRVESDLWEAFGQLVGARNRSAVIRDFIRWFVRERGAQLPVRPGGAEPVHPDDDPELMKLLKQARNDLVHGRTDGVPFSSDQAEALTAKELEVLFLVADGRTPIEISMFLGVTLKTVQSYIKSVAAKVSAAGQVKIFLASAGRPHFPGADS